MGDAPTDLASPDKARAADEARRDISLRCIKRIDEKAVSILSQSTYVGIYLLNPQTKKWERFQVEGFIYIFERTEAPWHRLLVLNQKSLQNFMEDITVNWELSSAEHFVYFRPVKNILELPIRGLWFYDDSEREKVFFTLRGILNGLGASSMSGIVVPSPPSPLAGERLNRKAGREILSLIGCAPSTERSEDQQDQRQGTHINVVSSSHSIDCNILKRNPASTISKAVTERRGGVGRQFVNRAAGGWSSCCGGSMESSEDLRIQRAAVYSLLNMPVSAASSASVSLACSTTSRPRAALSSSDCTIATLPLPSASSVCLPSFPSPVSNRPGSSFAPPVAPSTMSLQSALEYPASLPVSTGRPQQLYRTEEANNEQLTITESSLRECIQEIVQSKEFIDVLHSKILAKCKSVHRAEVRGEGGPSRHSVANCNTNCTSNPYQTPQIRAKDDDVFSKFFRQIAGNEPS